MTENDTSEDAPEEVQEKSLPNDGEWGIARQYLQRLGEPSALFTNCSRNLVKCSETGNGKLSKLAASQLSNLLKSPSMLSQIFHAAKTYYFQDIASRGAVEPADFAFFIQPSEIAIIIAIGYTTRRTAQVLSKQDWDLLWEPYQRYADIAMPLGFAIPAIGPTRALMTAAGKFLGCGLFNLVDPESFKKYRIANKVAKRSHSLKEESEKFGTTHLHIACLIWQRFGFGIQVSEDYFAGLSNSRNEAIAPNATKFRVAGLWLESLMENGNPPTQDLGDDYELEESREAKFIEVFQTIKDQGSQFKWLLKTRDDISEEKTPDLLADYEGMRKILKKRGRAGTSIDSSGEEED